MSNDYQGIATVITASQHLGTKSEERVNEAVPILLTSSDTPLLMRLSFDAPLEWPGHPTFVTIHLPDGTCVSGSISDMERPIDGPGWVTFTMED